MAAAATQTSFPRANYYYETRRVDRDGEMEKLANQGLEIKTLVPVLTRIYNVSLNGGREETVEKVPKY